MKEAPMKTILHPTLAMAMTVAALTALATSAAPAFAQAASPPAQTGAAPISAAAGSAEMSEGVVRKIDREQGQLTLKHGEIKNLDMPGMTMVFNAKDKSLLDGLTVGDKVRFRAIKEGAVVVVVELAAVQ